MSRNVKIHVIGWILLGLSLTLFAGIFYLLMAPEESAIISLLAADRDALVHIWVYLAVVAFPLLACSIVLLLGFEEKSKNDAGEK